MSLATLRRAGVITALLCSLLGGCSDNSDHGQTPAQALLAQFGVGAALFSESGMQALLDFEDASSPVVLLQLMNVTDAAGFARYEESVAPLWASVGGAEVFAGSTFARMIGERELVAVRALSFPNMPMLVDALRSAQFATAARTLFDATDDHAWVLGIATQLPFEISGGYLDPGLLSLDETAALARLAAVGGAGGDGFAANVEAIVDMLVSDSPEPFFMVNLIDFYDRANYADGRSSELSGEQANDLYGQAIAPRLLAHNSGPELLFPVSVVLTAEAHRWEQAVVVRYASRDAFLNIFALNPAAGDALLHKEAGVENTLVYATEPRWASPPEPANGPLFNLRYCEILLPRFDPGDVEVEVWGTQGLNLCPQDAWDALDPAALAAEAGVPVALKNGPRFFTVDWISNTAGLAEGEPRFFGAIEMVLLTTARPSEFAAETPYSTTRVARDNIWHFSAGRRVYELVNPDGVRYVMQSFSRIVDPALTLSDLSGLGERLDLPTGWRFESRVLDATLEVPAIDGVAEVVQDDLSNTYQRIP